MTPNLRWRAKVIRARFWMIRHQTHAYKKQAGSTWSCSCGSTLPNETAECRDCSWLAVGDGLDAALRHTEKTGHRTSIMGVAI